MKHLILLTCSLCAILAVPVPSQDKDLEFLRIPLNENKELDVISLAEGENEQIERNKRTIGVLRELFPELTKIVEQKIQQKVQMLLPILIRTIGPILLRSGGLGALAGGTTNNDSDSTNDDDDDETSSSSSGDKKTTKGSNGRKVSIQLPSYPSDDDDDDDDDDTAAVSSSSTTTTTTPVPFVSSNNNNNFGGQLSGSLSGRVSFESDISDKFSANLASSENEKIIAEPSPPLQVSSTTINKIPESDNNAGTDDEDNGDDDKSVDSNVNNFFNVPLSQTTSTTSSSIVSLSDIFKIPAGSSSSSSSTTINPIVDSVNDNINDANNVNDNFEVNNGPFSFVTSSSSEPSPISNNIVDNDSVIPSSDDTNINNRFTNKDNDDDNVIPQTDIKYSNPISDNQQYLPPTKPDEYLPPAKPDEYLPPAKPDEYLPPFSGNNVVKPNLYDLPPFSSSSSSSSSVVSSSTFDSLIPDEFLRSYESNTPSSSDNQQEVTRLDITGRIDIRSEKYYDVIYSTSSTTSPAVIF